MASGCKIDAGLASTKIVSDPATFVLQKDPAFIAKRNALFEELYKKQQESLKELESSDITIQFEVREGEVLTLNGKAFQTSPYDLILSVDKKRAKKIVVAQYENDSGVKDLLIDIDEHDEAADSEWTLWDMTRPLEGSCHVKVLDFDSELGKHVFWHSSAHMLGSALETFYGAFLTIGPALSSGFYYDCFMGTNTLKPEDVKGMITHVDKMSISNKPFERLICTKEEALQLMSYNPFKVDLIKRKIADGEKTVCYRCGDFVDLCRGPHVPFTSFIKGASFDILKASSCYWLSNSDADSLQRVYGISFPEKDQLKSYHARIEEAKQRDHRLIGTQLNLFYFDSVHSPGSCFWLPNGAKIYNRLTTFLRDNYRVRGYQEVVTPNIYSCDLWRQSGHYDNYKENMYTFMSDDTEWGMKPMNCPGHCLMFKHMNLSYRQLPLRLADFGVLHRNELTGSLSGLTRVRRFQQDDAHIFCTQDQIMDEVLDLINFIGKVYSLFNFRYEFKLSTKPAKALGDEKLWEIAEASLTEALNRSGNKWTLNPGDGAFYGPKIDIVLFDCLDREHQCGTIQLDFNLPIRFNLEYRDKSFDETANSATEKSESGLRNGFSRPVIIHRAILGSIERFIAIVLEQTKGKLPFWLSPTQVLIIPISDKHLDYADFVYNTLLSKGYNVEVDKTTNTMNKKIKFGQQQRWNYMAIVGDREKEDKTVSLRPLDTDAQQVMTIDELLKLLESHNLSVV
ncbi:threonyl-tRNA synthetase, putative [Theileria equi strain WA]|uniref:Probable threonine--tRNA ligase, cytoplasmic n=1 Tax=Theileria equi strain WA TaxID=1537102 RepID=L1LG17_THEEQ|nr:threonyl-tRNA synthetase, putative [Theileria equi strain WA]EKX74103.1 threonyl-tRNA synthetase, putative [Theileria equi strain WA]|eukprot:XP_004833555.1 threonyl-tRNA synthetase, putative [Theileria equi strain WA]